MLHSAKLLRLVLPDGSHRSVSPPEARELAEELGLDIKASGAGRKGPVVLVGECGEETTFSLAAGERSERPSRGPPGAPPARVSPGEWLGPLASGAPVPTAHSPLRPQAGSRGNREQRAAERERERSNTVKEVQVR